MVNESTRFEAEDRIQRERVEAKSGFENYAYSMRNTINDPSNAGGKLAESDKSAILSAVDEAIKWLETAQSASKEEYEGRQKELEGLCNPIISRMYQQGEGGMHGSNPVGGMPGGFGAGGAKATGPRVEEVD